MVRVRCIVLRGDEVSKDTGPASEWGQFRVQTRQDASRCCVEWVHSITKKKMAMAAATARGSVARKKKKERKAKKEMAMMLRQGRGHNTMMQKAPGRTE